MNNRDLNLSEIEQRTDCSIVRRNDVSSAKQVAVVWVSGEGEAPEVQGVVLILYCSLSLL